jgi:hypothetical protein
LGRKHVIHSKFFWKKKVKQNIVCICLDFGYCGSKKIRAYGFFYLENLFFNSFTTQKHLKNTLDILLNSLMALKNIKNLHKNLKSIRNNFFFPSSHVFPPINFKVKKKFKWNYYHWMETIDTKINYFKGHNQCKWWFFLPTIKIQLLSLSLSLLSNHRIINNKNKVLN